MIRKIRAKSILNRHRKRDPWFMDDYTLNPYQNCDFGCSYCYIRGSKYGRPASQDVVAKVNAPNLLERELARRARKREYGVILISSATEAWMHAEEELGLTRRCLQVISRYRFPVHCLTKSKLILRDLDFLKLIDKSAVLPDHIRKLGRGVFITLSLSTLDEKVSKIFEPNAPGPNERLETLQKVKEFGFYAGVAYIPVLPLISDSEEQLEEMIKTAREFQADYVLVGSLTLFGAGKDHFYRVLERRFPGLLREYKRLFGSSHQLPKAYRLRLRRTARELCKRFGLKFGLV